MAKPPQGKGSTAALYLGVCLGSAVKPDYELVKIAKGKPLDGRWRQDVRIGKTAVRLMQKHCWSQLTLSISVIVYKQNAAAQ
jgi:hypothetical protein